MQKLATIDQMENILFQNLSHSGSKCEIFRIFRLLLNKLPILRILLGKIKKSVANLCNFDENFAKIARLEIFLLQNKFLPFIIIIIIIIHSFI